jgi:hypothetical protein
MCGVAAIISCARVVAVAPFPAEGERAQKRSLPAAEAECLRAPADPMEASTAAAAILEIGPLAWVNSFRLRLGPSMPAARSFPRVDSRTPIASPRSSHYLTHLTFGNTGKAAALTRQRVSQLLAEQRGT